MTHVLSCFEERMNINLLHVQPQVSSLPYHKNSSSHQLTNLNRFQVIWWYDSISVFLIYYGLIILGAGKVGNHNQFRKGLGSREGMDSVTDSKVPAEHIFLLFIIYLIKNELNCFVLWRHMGSYSKRAFCAI